MATVAVNILLGKISRPQSSNDSSGARYESVWACILLQDGLEGYSYEGFNGLMMSEVNAKLRKKAPGETLTFFSPLGRYMSLHKLLYPRISPGSSLYIPPPTILMTNASARPQAKRPIWVDFTVYSRPPPKNTLTGIEIPRQLKRLDSLLANGPDGHNTLHLAEIPSTAPDLTSILAVTKETYAYMAELTILVLTLNPLSGPLQYFLTRRGKVRDPAVLRKNYLDFLSALSRDLVFQWDGEEDSDPTIWSSHQDLRSMTLPEFLQPLIKKYMKAIDRRRL
ncbi:hypothetical protein J7T55_012368 [Diaporthe amygdali]|uniref:uncharacterized protein n=1 Tax=Phomopsis amygdali TaxID=1214568 RepID=UPI0022FE31A6|nr:uncharacterized protein J7T55_012368 [Diaporthe amygdali]KAJ0123896.1 hypothetical protein J7T55_012368 [Diaporthe amygdali]